MKDPGANILDIRAIPVKVWKYSDEADSAGIQMTYSSISMTSGPKTGIFVDDDFGIILKGDVGFTSMPNKVKFAGLWRLNNLMTSTVPSTIITPLPTLTFQLPAETMLRTLRKITGILGGILGA